ncbi:MAG: hypothetical protein ABIK10_02110 [candidate division WOR-3 bacterium]
MVILYDAGLNPYAGTFNEWASSIVVAPSGNVYICGYTMCVNAGDYLIVKLHGQTGDTVWLRTYDAQVVTAMILHAELQLMLQKMYMSPAMVLVAVTVFMILLR